MLEKLFVLNLCLAFVFMWTVTLVQFDWVEKLWERVLDKQIPNMLLGAWCLLTVVSIPIFFTWMVLR